MGEPLMTTPIVPIRVPPHVAAIWKLQAEAEGVSLSEWIRRACASRVVLSRLGKDAACILQHTEAIRRKLPPR